MIGRDIDPIELWLGEELQLDFGGFGRFVDFALGVSMRASERAESGIGMGSV
jgi:hypothetical protein